MNLMPINYDNCKALQLDTMWRYMCIFEREKMYRWGIDKWGYIV